MQGFNAISSSYLQNYEKYLQLNFLNILKNFKSSIDDLDHLLELKILKMIVKISKIIVSNALLINEKFILDKIKKVLKSIKNKFTKPKLFIHPGKRKIIEEKFGTLLKLYNWKIVVDDKINLNSCYVITNEGEIDATVERCWNEIERVLFLKKDSNKIEKK